MKKLKRACRIYKIECVNNGMIYVGQSGNIEYRWTQHRGLLKTKEHHNQILQRCYDKYGKESIAFSVLLECDLMELDHHEEATIHKLKNEGRLVINIADVAASPMRGRKHTNETKKIISEKNKGRRWSELARNRISEQMKGRKMSDSTKETLRASNTGRKRPDLSKRNEERNWTEISRAKIRDSLTGKSPAIETRERMRAAHTGMKHTEQTRQKMKESWARRRNEIKSVSAASGGFNLQLFAGEGY